MRFNFVSETGDGMGLAARVIEEGNEACIWIRSKDGASIGDGIVPKIGDLDDICEQADPQKDIVIFDGSGNGIAADYLRQQGIPVLGGSRIADKLERDRAFGASVMQGAGIRMPKTKTFFGFAEAIRYVQNNSGKRLVYKPSKLLGELSCSHVTNDADELVEYLQLTEREASIAEPEFDLQEFTPGLAISTEMWFDGEKFVDGLWNHTFERKELMDGNLGPSGGCTGNIVWACGDCPLCRRCRKMQDFLQQEHYVGPIDLNAIITESGNIYGLEWTPRFGYDATPTLMWELISSDLSQFLADAAKGQNATAKLQTKIAGGVRVTMPPWPTEKYLAHEGVLIAGLPKKLDDIYMYNVKMLGSKMYSAGAWGILLLLTGAGSTIKQALAVPYRQCADLRIGDMQYRTDLVAQFTDDMQKLDSFLGLE